MILSTPGNLVELLRRRAEQQPDRRAYLFLADGEREEASLTYAQLDREARAIGAALQAAAAAGERVLLLYPPGLDYVSAFLGCLYAGAVAVPAYPPRRPRDLRRLQSIVSDSQATLALTTASILSEVRPRIEPLAGFEPVRWLATPFGEGGLEDGWREPAVDGGTLAFLQYTSGSTADPKGVMVSHANLLCNERMIQLAYGHSEDTVFAGWLPLYHDMGLIGNVLQPLFLGVPSILMSPAAFLQKPLRWLQAISRYRATTSGGPDFAYRLCVRRIPPAERERLDLGSWSVAFNGAEPVRAETLEEFADAFAGCGFRRTAFCPCYGLAEATLFASGGARDSLPTIFTVSGDALGRHRAVAAAAREPDARPLVGCGGTWLGQRIVIADPEALTSCPPDRIGEVWLAGPNVARGYWRRHEETERTFAARLADTGEGPFLRTGDLGFLRDGELFVTGRLKDLIILRGVNHYPQDIERTAEGSHRGLSPGANAAFSAEIDGEERLVLVQELRRDCRSPDAEEVARAIRQAVSEEHEAQVHTVVLIQHGSIAKTSSGKIQRHANRAAFLAGGLVEVGRSPVGSTVAEAAPPAAPEGESFIRRALRTIQPGPERRSLLRLYLQEQAARALRLPPARVEPGVPLAALGIDSLAAIELQSELESSLGVVLPAAGLLAGPTLDDLAADVLAALDAPPAAPAAQGPVPASAAGELQPLSYGQRALWYLHQREPESPAYNVAAAMAVEPPLDRAALRRALQGLVDRHPALRTRFGTSLGEAWQQVLPAAELAVEEEDAAGWDAAELDRRLAREAYRPFDLERAPLLRIHIFSRAGGETVLLLVMHHLVTDFWSLAVFLAELGELYGACRSGARPDLPPLAVQYGDFVRWEAERLAGGEGERLWSYWREQMSGELPLLDLPADRPRPPVPTGRGARWSHTLGGGLGDRLEALARSRGATLHMTLMAAFQALLHRYTGQTDLLVGTPMAGRGRAGLAGVIGYFVNVVVLRGDLRGDPDFGALLDRTRQRSLAAFAHQDFPFPLLVERLQPERDPSRSPLFQVLFVLQKAQLRGQESLAAMALGETRARLRLGELGLRPQPIEEQVAQLDLRLWAAEAADGALLFSWQYSSDLFDAATVARMGGHFETLLRGIIADPADPADPGTPLSGLPLLTAGERSQLLAPPALRSGEDAGACLHHLFEEQAERSPEARAVTFEGQNLTYAELNRRANRLAHHLISLGAGPEARIGLSLEPSCELPVAILAILKAGGAYVPLDPSYPPERLGFVLEDARVPVLVTEGRLLRRLIERGLPPPRAEIVRLDEDGAAIARHSAANPGPRATAANAVYVIFTSGSTGRPKGVVAAHRHVVRLFQATRHWYGFGAGDVFTLCHSFAFDVSVWELWGALLHGGRLVVLPYWLVRTPEALHELLERERVTVLCQTPSAFRPLLQADQARPEAGRLALRWIIFAGEALELRSLRPWFARHGDREPTLVNMYGITETLVHATFRPLSEADGERMESFVGVAIPDLQILVLDRSGQPVPVGVTGELYVGGAGLARGYLDRPELTAERFVPNPFHGAPGERLYRSGDLVRRTADGDLEYMGRADQQVKIRGFRIELGEIESVLGEHPAVERAVVVAADGASGGKRLVAYLVSPGGAPPASELREHLRARLPDFMLPAVFVALAALPLTPSGKVDRRALPAPEPARPEAEQAYVAPRNRVEAQLAEIWSEVLGLAQVGVTDNFFTLGGDSILSIQVVARARQLGHRLTPRQAFEHQTIAELAAVAAVAAGTAQEPGPPGTEGPWRLTPMQQGLLFHSVYEAGLEEYLVQVLLRLEGPLDAGAFTGAWRLAVERHPVLRTSFRWQDLDEAVQVVQAAAEPPWLHDDWRALTAEEQESRLAELLTADRRRGFDLAAAPLLRLALLRLEGERHQLVVTFHHLILDGWSAAALLKEVFTAYAALCAGRLPALPPAPPFRDYLAWLAGQDQDRAEAFWRRRLRGFAAPTPLPADRPPGAVEGPPRYDERRLALSPAVTAGLGAFGRRRRLTQSTLVQAAWALVLARHAGERDVVFGGTVAGRPADLPGVESMLGLLINTLPVRVLTAPEQPLLAWLGSLQEQLVEMRQHEHSALNAVQGWSEMPRGQALFDSIVIFESYPLDRSLLERRGGLAASAVRSVEWTHYPLSLTALPGGELALQLVFDRRRFDGATVHRLLSHLERFLGGLAAAGEEASGARLGDAAILTAAQEQQLLREWNDSRAAAPPDACLHERFAEMAALRGDATAVEEPGSGGRHWSYRELERRANQLAHHLRALGVGPEILVGLCVGRRLEMVAAHLAVLKAGGGCVPLDPGYPAARLAFMLADGGISVLVTEQSLLPALPEHSARVVLVDAEAPRIAGLSGAPPASGAHPDNVAYVIYTSGSTGAPKAVMMPHRSLARFVSTAVGLYGLLPGDRVLQLGSVSFDAAVEEIYGCLAVGATLVLRGDSMMATTASFLAECEALGITVLDLPTAFWHELCAGLAAGLALPAGLRSVVIAGERAAPERLADWLRHAPPGVLLTNAYGPTEGTIVASAFAPRPADAGNAADTADAVRREVPVGRPIGNVRVHVLDPGLLPVPIGGVGELHLGGAGVTRGYLRRPGLTAEAFVPDPFGEEPGGRLYRTGDLARHLADGTLELVGRIDGQVKLRGFRVELGEIESALLQHPAVQQAAVQPWAGAGGDKRLVAYVVAKPSAPPPAAQELRRFLMERLPPYMVPPYFQSLAALPLTASGSKVDRRALPPPEDARPDLGTPYVAPRSEIEIRLAEIWSKVLGVGEVGLADSFFELGGDSILSLQATARAHQAGLRFTPKQLFESQTLGELAAVVELARPAAAEQEPETGELPLTPIQEWFFSLGLPRPEHWNQAVLLAVAPGDGVPGADPGAWQQAIAALLRHHDALRFAFPPPVAGRRRALAAATGAVPFAWCDLTALPAAARALATAAAAAQVQASLSLTGPLLRAVYFDLGADRPARLLLAIHHLVVDGVSWRILIEDLAAVCRQLRGGGAPRLPLKTSSFKQWAEHLAGLAGSPELEPEIGRWLALAAPHGGSLPFDFQPADRAAAAAAAPANTEADAAVVRTALGEDETKALLREVPPAYGTDINDVLLSALLRALAPWTGSPALLIELEGHGREPLFEHLDVSRTVGWFTTAFPVLLELPLDDGDPGAVLKTVKEQLRAVPGRGIGYGLLRFLHPDPALRRQLERLPRPAVGFNYLGQIDQVLGGGSPFTLAPEPAGAVRDPRGARSHLLEIESRISDGRLGIEWVYSRRLHRAGTIERLAGAYLAELRTLIEHCRSRGARGYTPSDFPQMSFDQGELDALLDGLAGSLEGGAG